MTAIASFRGENYFLSNYYDKRSFSLWNMIFHSGEQAFAYAKTFYSLNGTQDRAADNIIAARTPGEAKRAGRQVKLDVPAWDNARVGRMRDIIRAKFENQELAGKLLNTGHVMLVEGNDWGDKFWGRCQENGVWVGENTLGVLLMEHRGYLRGVKS